jgi:acyl-CoA dehydrogenase
MTVSDSADSAILTVSRTAAEYADAVDRANCIPEHALAALRSAGQLSVMIPPALGGQGRSLSQIAAVCHALARSCGSSAMIFAMHQIQVACVVAHGQRSEWHRSLLQRLCSEQLLLGSVTSEAGTGGNIHASVCCVEMAEGRITLEKDATTISYGAHSDALLITARRSRDAAPSDQVMLVGLRDHYALERTATWDALGMRGTCSEGFRLRMTGDPDQILPTPFADIASQTMLPVSHLLWSSVWLGIAADAVARARNYLRQQARNGRGALSPGAHRLARGVGLLQLMQSRLSMALKDYESAFAAGPRPLPLGFTADMNNLKTSVSELCLEVVQHAFMVCGISAYKNGSEYSLGRHFRDLLSAPIMINNDRMLESTGNLLLMQKPALGVF